MRFCYWLGFWGFKKALFLSRSNILLGFNAFFCLKNFIVKKWVFVLLFSILFYRKTHFLKVLKVLFYFLKGIGVNFALDPPKRKASKEKREFKKEIPLKKES